MRWQISKNFSALTVDKVHIWRANLARPEKEIANFLAILNVQERERADRFMVQAARSSFIVARAILRQLLARYLTVKAQEVIFRQNSYGKLYVDATPLQFNLSHSHGLAVFIFALETPVGIDVEFIRDDYNFEEIAQKFFSPIEAAQLFALPEEQRPQAFFNCWSRKEAFIKALGTGMFSSLDKFAVEVFYNKEGVVKLLQVENDLDQKSWRLEAFDPMTKYAGAFAVKRSSACTTSFYDF